MSYAALLALGLALGGCVSAFPEGALRSVDRSVSLAELRRDPKAYVNRRVILGGEILAARPRVGETELEVLSRRLRGDDSPERTDDSDGRFLVKTGEFLDPAVYAPGRRVTVVGGVVGDEERTIGELPYRYPVITAERIRLWPREVAEPPAFHPAIPWGFYDWPYYHWSYYRWPYYRWPYYRSGRIVR